MYPWVVGLIVVVTLAGSCSTSEPAATSPPVTDPTSQAPSENTDDAANSEEAPAAQEPTPLPEPVLADQGLTSITDLAAGEQVADAQGNIIAIYGVAAWPRSFAALDDQTQAEFPFYGDVAAVADTASALVVLDVGMCAAGIDANGFGTVEFFVHRSATDVLSIDPVQDRGVLARHAVVRPGFAFPDSAECTRGWLPVLWAGSEPPQVARYVLATRPQSSSDVEQHVYQWKLDQVSAPVDTELAADDSPVELFQAGQQVTFNDGRLDGTTVEIDGWAELIGEPSPIEGTRLVAVSASVCPASLVLPEFGLGVDGWNLVAPLGQEVFGADAASDPTQQCFAGWMRFAVPFGGEPTSFFVSDGRNAETGYAEWSLAGAAVAAPE